MNIFIDTNIFIRYLIADDPKKFLACKRLFKKAIKNELQLVTIPLVIAEVGWVLYSYYNEIKEDIIKKLKTIIFFKQLKIIDREILILSIEFFENNNVDFIDAYIYAWLKKHKIDKIYSYDKDFDKLEDNLRIEP